MKRLLPLILAALIGCAKASGAPAVPSLDILAAGDTAKLFVSWQAATKATGALLSVNVTQSNGTWTALPVNQVVAAGGTATVIAVSATADSALFQACMKSTSGALTSAQACSNTRQWKRTLQPPVVTIDSLVALLVNPPSLNVMVGVSGQLCGYFKFASGHVAMRAGDVPVCNSDYTFRFTALERLVSNTEQVFVNGRCIKWTSSNPIVATVTTDPGCTGLGYYWMGVPIEALRT